MPKISWSKNGMGYYYLIGDTWFYLGAWSGEDSARKHAELIGLDPKGEVRQFLQMPADMKNTSAKMPRPTVFCYEAQTMILAEDWNQREVWKHINVIAPNEAVARYAIQQILREADPYTREVKKHRGITQKYVRKIVQGRLPFVDNNHVYFMFRDFDLEWTKVS